jgi:diaminohydroxyphosphoribosylaminopyrimidine deaminase / 5-amino-6-(5-phosphoribosylamino)uracil reductase
MADRDLSYMDRALELAREGKGLTSPNPMVGAVLVRDEMIVGEGFYRYAERDHAEVWAIQQAGVEARGATLYVNLEPCSHFGRTGPCCDLILRAGISQVVAAMQDPNPLVSGAGFNRLEGSGIKLSLGLREAEARRLNESFCKYITTRRPFVTLKAGMTLDGKIAGANGRSKWITSEDSRLRVQQLRFEADAILAGIGTVLKDDPLLTDRSQRRRRRPLLRVILDARLRLPLESKLVRSRSEGDIILFCSEERELSRQRRLEEMGIEVFPVPVIQEKISFQSVLDELGRREITSLLIEGGSAVNFEALRSQSVDKVVFFVSPKILGGKEAVPVVGGRGFLELEKSLPLTFTDVERLGPDLIIEAYLNKPKGPETS